MRIFLYTILCCLLGTGLIAQTITVRDLVTTEPLSGASVSAGGMATPIYTDAKGIADITNLNGALSITISLTGYETVSLTPEQIKAMQYMITLYPNGIYTGEVVVSASKFEEKQEDIANQVQVISRSDLRFMNQQTTADVLQHTGNVLVQKSQQGGGSPIIRGMEANKVLMVVDGVRMNNAIYRGGHLHNVITLDNSIMDRVEISYGPGSVVYGSDALGGVMHFYTRKPLLSGDEHMLVNGNAFVRTATANKEFTSHADFNLGGKRLASLTSISFSSFDDLRSGDLRPCGYDSFGRRYFYVERINNKDSVIVNSNPNIQVGTGYKQWDVLQKILFAQNEYIKHTVNLQYSNSTDVPRYDRLSEGTADAPVNAVWYYGPQKRFLASYNLMHTRKNTLYDDARIVLAYQAIEESRHNRGFNSTHQSNRTENVEVISLNADFQKQLGNNEFRYGLEVTGNDVQSEANRVHVGTGEIAFQNTRYPDGGSAMITAAAYITDAFEINEQLVLNAGVRYSSISLDAKIDSTNIFVKAFNDGDSTDYYFLNGTTISQMNRAVNGSFGLVLKPQKDWNIALNAATGFRAPNVDDAGKLFEQIDGAILIPNEQLKPETCINVDLRIGKTINKRVFLQATGFYNLIQKLIALGNAEYTSTIVDSVTLPAVTNVNRDKAYIYGVNAQMEAQLNNAFSVSSAFNYTYGRIKGGAADTPLDHIPPIYGRAAFNYQTGKFRSEFFVMYNGWKRWKDYRLGAEDNERYAIEGVGMPAWYTLNLRTQYQINNYLQAQVACENILNHHYRVFASGTSGAGRNLMLTLRARF